MSGVCLTKFLPQPLVPNLAILSGMGRLVVGIVGEAGAGKGEVAKILTELGFTYHSLSDDLRTIATNIGLSHDRDVLISLGNALRGTFGSDIVARGVNEWLVGEEKVGNVVVDSIRNPGEVEYLQRELDAFVIGVTMSDERRFELMKERGRKGDPTTWDEFQALLRRERGDGENASGQQLLLCLEKVNVVVENNGSLAELKSNIKEALSGNSIANERLA